MTWDENEHPRDGDGKFIDKDGDLGKSENKFKNFKNPHKGCNKFRKMLIMPISIFMNVDYSGYTDKQLKKSIKSLEND